MKKIVALILLLSVISLMGCSKVDPNKPVTVKWEDGVTTINGKPVYFTEYWGTGATIEGGQAGKTWHLSIDHQADVTHIEENHQGVMEENMDKYKGKFHFSTYLGTQFVMAASIGEDTWSVCTAATERDDDLNVIAVYASDYIDAIPLTDNQVYCDFGTFVLGTDYDVVKVRPTGALISGVIKVSQDAHACSETYTVYQGEEGKEPKEYTLMRDTSKDKYDYYSYDGMTIQIAKGLDIANYITFK